MLICKVAETNQLENDGKKTVLMSCYYVLGLFVLHVSQFLIAKIGPEFHHEFAFLWVFQIHCCILFDPLNELTDLLIRYQWHLTKSFQSAGLHFAIIDLQQLENSLHNDWHKAISSLGYDHIKGLNDYLRSFNVILADIAQHESDNLGYVANLHFVAKHLLTVLTEATQRLDCSQSDCRART